MKHFKLIFSRFTEMENLNVTITSDGSQAVSEFKKVGNEANTMGQTLVKASDAVSNLNTKLGRAKFAQNLVSQFKQTITQMKELAATSQASDKFKLRANTNAAKVENSGLLDKSLFSYTQADINKIIGMNQSFGSANITERQRQLKIAEKQEAAEAKIAAIEKERQSVLQNLNNVLGEIVQKKEHEAMINNLKDASAQETMMLRTGNISNSLTPAQLSFEKFKNAVGDAGFMINKVSSASEGLSNNFHIMVGKLKQAAITWRILYGAFSQIWNILSATVEKAAAYEEALNLYRVAMAGYVEEADAWAKKISEALYLDPKSIMQYTGALYNLVQGLGVSKDAAYVMSTNLTQLAYDMSSYLNIDVQSAYDKLQSAMTGQSRAVASAGIAMQQASLQELAYSLGIEKLVTNMTQAEKTYLRYIQIMRSTTNMQGDLARTIVTPENALRVVKQQFELLGRAIGQVFIPIIMKAIPYVMALTQALTALATRLAKSLGFEFAQIDYDSLTTADTAVEDTFTNMSNNAAGAAKSIKGSINRTLAAFDELNVVESESSGSGGGGGVGGVPGSNVLGDLEPYITGYDMLQGLTDELSKRVEAARKNLDTFLKIIKAIGIAFATWKGIKFVNGLINMAKALKTAFIAGEGLPGLIKLLATRFADGYKYAKYFGEGGLSAVGSGLRNMLGPIGTAIGGLASIGGSFLAAEKSMKNYNAATDSALGTTLSVTAAVGGLTVAAGLLLGPVGALAAGVAGLTGLFLGATENVENFKKEIAEQEAYNKLFDGVGVSINTVSNAFDSMSKKVSSSYKEIEAFKSKVDSTEENVIKARNNINSLHEAILYGFDDENTIDNLKIAVDNFKDAINQNKQANIDYYNSFVTHLRNQGYITDQEYKDMTKKATDYYTTMALMQSEYSDEYLAIQKKYKVGTKEYDDAMKDLELRYLGLIPTESDVADGFTNIYSQAVKKINLENPEKLNELMDNLNQSLDDGRTSIEKSKEEYEKYINGLITQDEKAILSIQRRLDEDKTLDENTRKRLQKNMDDRKKDLENHETDKKKVLEGFERDNEALNTQYLNFVTTILAQIEQSGASSDTKAGVWAKRIRKTLEQELSDNTNIKNAGYDLFTQYVDSVYKSGGQLSPDLIKYFKELGIDLGSEATQAIIDETTKSAQNTSDYTFAWDMYLRPELRNNFMQTGQEAGTALNNGLVGMSNSLAQTGTAVVDKFLQGASNEAGIPTPSGSPSASASPNKGVGLLGKTMGLGLINTLTGAINTNKTTVSKEVNNLTTDIQKNINKNPFSLKFNSTEPSFNSILKTLKSFSSKWGTGITDILNNTKISFGGLSFKDGKLSFNPFKLINIKLFAEGGYPTSGDLFFANENGRAEYITSLGNKTAVANQDQMVSALTNAILQGMSAIETNRQPGVTQVYIGNEKIYEGQGQYQNRQAERYGTTLIKI